MALYIAIKNKRSLFDFTRSNNGFLGKKSVLLDSLIK
jgi:hypothetical protein